MGLEFLHQIVYKFRRTFLKLKIQIIDKILINISAICCLVDLTKSNDENAAGNAALCIGNYAQNGKYAFPLVTFNSSFELG